MKNRHIDVVLPEIAVTIKNARIERGLTQEGLEKLSGVFQSEISRLEKAYYVPRAEIKINRIFAVLGLKNEKE